MGNLYASQLFEQARAELGDLETAFRAGQFLPLRQWLQTKVHSQGREYPAAELVRRITGEPISPTALMGYLRAKFTPLYALA